MHHQPLLRRRWSPQTPRILLTHTHRCICSLSPSFTGRGSGVRGAPTGGASASSKVLRPCCRGGRVPLASAVLVAPREATRSKRKWQCTSRTSG
jgi:hypothetical protein